MNVSPNFLIDLSCFWYCVQTEQHCVDMCIWSTVELEAYSSIKLLVILWNPLLNSLLLNRSSLWRFTATTAWVKLPFSAFWHFFWTNLFLNCKIVITGNCLIVEHHCVFVWDGLNILLFSPLARVALTVLINSKRHGVLWTQESYILAIGLPYIHKWNGISNTIKWNKFSYWISNYGEATTYAI